jgi:beta-lactam-binding protein with PASTA domain
MLPARCPRCGANLGDIAGDEGERGAKAASTSRSAVEGLVGNAGVQPRRHFRFLVAILIVALSVAGFVFIGYKSGLWGDLSVPDVVGWRAERAQSEVESKGLSVKTTEQKDDGQAGFVLSESPSAGSMVARDATVTLTVSVSRVMPDVVGKSEADARSLVEAEGVTVNVTEQASDQQAGTVISADHDASATLVSTDVVDLVVARAPTVPDCVGKTEADATKAITDEGLVANITYATATSGQAEGTVMSMDVSAGTTLALGQTVNLTVANDRIKRLEDTSTQILIVVYSCDPIANGGYPVGAGLRQYLSDSLGLSSASDQEIWEKVVKGSHTAPTGAENLGNLVRSIVGTPEVKASSDGTVTATLTVSWDWSRLGEKYANVTSQDTRTVTMTFDDSDKLLTFTDDNGDMPTYTYAQ